MCDCVIITGMHRSGTSLAASYLQATGLFLGDNLMPAYRDNVKGYFEDVDVVHLHRRLLKEHHVHALKPKPFSVRPEDIERGTRLYEARKRSPAPRGWKDARAALFLDYWETIIEIPCYFMVYRHPLDVIASLIRRCTDIPVLLNPLVCASCYCAYNRKLVAFLKTHRQRCVLVHVKDLIDRAPEVVRRLNRRFDLNLSPRPIRCVYADNLLKAETRRFSLARLVYRLHQRELDAVYAELNRLNDMQSEPASTE